MGKSQRSDQGGRIQAARGWVDSQEQQCDWSQENWNVERGEEQKEDREDNFTPRSYIRKMENRGKAVSGNMHRTQWI
jgi:hypothetical protein